MPWELLRQASERGTAVAVVLNRVPKEAVPVIREHLGSMLKEQGLGTAPIFTVAETVLGADGLLPPDQIARLQSWLSALAKDARARALVVRQTLTGALDSLDPRIQGLVAGLHRPGRGAHRARAGGAGGLRSRPPTGSVRA